MLESGLPPLLNTLHDRTTPDNQTMQPSGEVGRLKMVDFPSPPADR